MVILNSCMVSLLQLVTEARKMPNGRVRLTSYFFMVILVRRAWRGVKKAAIFDGTTKYDGTGKLIDDGFDG